MTMPINQQCFRSELVGWTWRGILCAVPSSLWAVMAGFTHLGQIIAMVLGVCGYILTFAFVTTWFAAHTTRWRAEYSRALKIAAAIKAATLVGAAGWWAISLGFLPKVTGGLVVLVWPDLCLGLGSTQLVQLLVRVREPIEIAQQSSFVLTGLITLLQGAFLSVLLALIALAVLGSQRVWLWAKRREFFPASV